MHRIKTFAWALNTAILTALSNPLLKEAVIYPVRSAIRSTTISD
ncbi:hypothetical protein [Empedobacter brevis]